MVSTSPFKVDGIDDLIRSILEINQAVGSLCVTHRAHGIIIEFKAIVNDLRELQAHVQRVQSAIEAPE
ncbi:hypothetical protein KXV75_005541, partial [Aspergillus fumigatus]